MKSSLQVAFWESLLIFGLGDNHMPATTWNATSFVRTMKTLRPASVSIVDTDGQTFTFETGASAGRNRWSGVLENLQALAGFKQVVLYDDSGAVLRIIPTFDATSADSTADDTEEEIESAVFGRSSASETTEEARIERIMALQIQSQSACLEQHYRLLKIVIDGFSELAKLSTERASRVERIQADSIERLVNAIQAEANAGQNDSLTQIATALAPAVLPLLANGVNNETK